ncbi:sensor domain-containing protein [Mycobacterium angelicum]|uniref:sensor domain-containing protein n=1 Tax=Mycobacterium angelicum TaxID=470074 RepID=UPI00147445C6|nr:sensor domain-containing protein [Mycobacterium angelicum]
MSAESLIVSLDDARRITNVNGLNSYPAGDIIQGVGVYRNDIAARAVFDRLIPELKACSALHAENYDFAVNTKDPGTVVPNSDRWKVIYGVKSSVFVAVKTLGYPDSDAVTSAVLRTITDRIR